MVINAYIILRRIKVVLLFPPSYSYFRFKIIAIDMTILQQPDALSLSGNIKDFRISTPGKISFVLLQGATEILSQSYDPGQVLLL